MAADTGIMLAPNKTRAKTITRRIPTPANQQATYQFDQYYPLAQMFNRLFSKDKNKERL
jgi:hypothetical protein